MVVGSFAIQEETTDSTTEGLIIFQKRGMIHGNQVASW